ncbi:MAG: hypothetical protein AAF236_04860 [Verrucomicrobiota bacterium]
MASLFSGPHNRLEVERNLWIFGWGLLIPSLGLIFWPNGWLLTAGILGGVSRLLRAAIVLPNESRGFLYHLLWIGLGGHTAGVFLATQFGWAMHWLYLVLALGAVAYSDSQFWRFIRRRLDA